MKQFTKIFMVIVIAALSSVLAWGQSSETIYTFTNKDWNATLANNTSANWTNYTSGDSFESSGDARGIAKSKATINGTSPAVLSNVTSITVVASANAAGPTLTIYKVVDNSETSIYSASMTKDNNKQYTVNLTGTNIFSGRIKVVLASSSSYKSVWIKSVAVTHSTGGSSPSINADDVEIAYNATSGSIAYTINNGVNGGVITSASVTSSTPSDWLSVTGSNPFSSPIGLTCSANPTASARTATVTLTYTYNTNQTVTKEVGITQAANPNIYNNISDITAVSTTYKVKGTVVATNARGFVIGDGTGYVYTYLNAAPSQAVNDMVTIQGTTSSYGHVIQFPSNATIAESNTSNYNNTPAVTVVDASGIAAYNSDYQKSDYVQFEGSLSTTTTTGNNPTTYYNIAVVTGNTTSNARISYPTSDQTSALSNLVGCTVRVKGYFAGFSSSYFTVMLESVEEVQVPTITVTPNTLSGFTYEEGNGPSTNKTISVSGSNLTANISLSLPNDSAYEISLSSDSNFSNSLSLTQTNGSVAATTIYVRLKAGKDAGDYNNVSLTLSSDGASNATVTLSGSVTEPEVQTYAELPFSYTSGKSGIADKDGLYESGLGNDYGSAPLLKFDGAGDYVLLQLEERPGTLSFSIKGNGSGSDPWAGTFKVLVSANGSSYDVLDSYSSLSSTTTTKTYESLDASIRYIKWVYETKTTGNVALGALSLAKYVAPSPTITVTADDPVNVSASAGSGELALSYDNFTVDNASDFDVQFYNSNNEEIENPDWITVEVVDATPSGYKVAYEVLENEGSARSAYFMVYAIGANDYVYSNLITINQAAPVVDYATLPFSYVGNESSTPTGLILSGTDVYSSSTPKIKFDTEGDYILLKINEVPGVLTYDIKGNSLDGSYKFSVLQSANGTDYSILKEYTSIGGSKTPETLYPASTTRYIKWVYTTRASGNVALGNIGLTVFNPTAPTISLGAVFSDGHYWTTFFNSEARYTLSAGAKAFTMNGNKQLYLLGDGSVIPAGVAVIVIADSSTITLTKSSDTEPIAVSGTENKLKGSNTAVPANGNQYVLGIANETLGFYLFTGSSIPAMKAYYEVEE